MVFAKKQLEAKEILEKKWHITLITDDIEHYVNKPNIKLDFDEELKLSKKYDIMRVFFDKIKESEALLICNYPKKWIDWYLGTSVLMELAVAYSNNKICYLLHDIDKSQPYALEVTLIDPIILNWDLNNI